MQWRKSFAAALTFGLACVSCSSKLAREAPPPQTAATNQEDATDQRGTIDVNKPYRASVDSPFLLVIRLQPKAGCGGDQGNNQLEPVPVRMDETSEVQYEPQQFKTVPCKNTFVKMTAKKKGTGLASIAAFADGYKHYSDTLDVGFSGKVKVTSTAPLSYDEAGTLNVEIVGEDDKPLSFNNDLSINLEAVDALLLTSDATKWANSATVPLKTGARSSPQFQIKSQNFRGGTIHLSTSLSLGDVILSQENHQFEVTPVWWLPIVLAIFGSVLYSIYSIFSDDKREKVKQKMGASLAAGVIAWLFTGFDLLGLKLDTHSLRTYAITGFLFCFLGVDVLLSKRFPRTIHTHKGA